MAQAKPPTRVSLGDVESTSERVPVGTYHARILDVTLRENKAKDGWYLAFEYIITSEGPSKGRHMWDNCSLKPNALWKLKSVLTACGVDADADWELEDRDDLKGIDVDIVVGEETRQDTGELASVVKRVKTSTAPSLEDLADEEEEDEEDEEDEDDEDEDDEAEEWTRDELEGLSVKELREIAKEAEVYEKGMSKDALVDAILGEDAEEDDDEEEDDDDPFEDEDEDEAPAPKKKARR